MRVIIGGIPGVGKTTVLNELTRAGFRVENYGDVMLKIATEKGYAKSRDEMRKLPIDIQTEIQTDAAMYFSQLKDVIIDTHFSIKTPSGYLPGLPPHVLKAINPELLVSIEADPLEIFERRKKDVQRHRDEESQSEIRMHLEVNRMFGIAYASSMGIPFMVVSNENNKSAEAANKIMEVLKRK